MAVLPGALTPAHGGAQAVLVRRCPRAGGPRAAAGPLDLAVQAGVVWCQARVGVEPRAEWRGGRGAGRAAVRRRRWRRLLG